MAYCEWCGLESKTDEVCEWCKRPLDSRGASGTKPELEYLRVADDDPNRGLQMAAIVGVMLFVGLIVYGAYTLGRGDDRVASTSATGRAPTRPDEDSGSRKDIQPQTSRYAAPVSVGTGGYGAAPATFVSQATPKTRVVKDSKNYRSAAIAYDTGDGESVPSLAVYVESAELNYKKNDFGQSQYEGRITIVNQSSRPIVRAKMTLTVGKDSYTLNPLRGNVVASGFDHIQPNTTTSINVRGISASQSASANGKKTIVLEAYMKDQKEPVWDAVEIG